MADYIQSRNEARIKEIVLQSWLYKSLPDSLQFVCSEDCSTCRCIFDVFSGGR